MNSAARTSAARTGASRSTGARRGNRLFGELRLLLGGAGVLLACTAATGVPEPQRPTGPTTGGACAGLTDHERRTPLLAREDIVAVRKLEERRGKQMYWQLDGAEVYLRTERDLGRARVARVARCQMSNPDPTRRAHDPLAVAGAQLKVLSADTAYVLQITAADPEQAREILRRAQALAPAARD